MIFEVFNQNSKYYIEMMNIILNAKNNPPEKGQLHHIVPRCWFKHYNMEVDNSISNTVLLSFEDHAKVHKLAYKCAKEKWFRKKMTLAAHLMGDKAANICGENNPMYGISSYYKCSPEEKTKRIEKQKKSSKGHKNPISHKIALSKIRAERNKKCHWYTNGKINKFCEICPKDFVEGRIINVR